MDVGTPNRNTFTFSPRKLVLPVAALIVVLVLIGFFALRKSSQSVAGISSNGQTSVEKAKAQETLNKDYNFSLKDEAGKEVSKVKYSVTTVEKRDEIIVKGQKASTVAGRTFLVVNLKITNSYEKALQINARDYLRLIINNSTEKLAPDIHNDPVEVQPQSTKETRVAFPIDDNAKNLVLQVGELTGKKDLLKLNLN